MRICSLLFVTNIIFQVRMLEKLVSHQNYFAITYQWIVSLVAFFKVIKFYYYEEVNYVYPLVLLITFRQSFTMLDFEGRRFWDDPKENVFFLISQNSVVIILLFCINFLFKSKKINVAATITNYLMAWFGTIIIVNRFDWNQESFFSLLLNNLLQILSGTLFLVFLWFAKDMMEKEKYELLKSNMERSELQNEYQHILDHFNDSVITQTKTNGIKYFNSEGFNLLKTLVND